ncbi:MAG TPA: alanine--tRNA ligase [Candidatus Bipolaricaulota bacterium]|nr:alanine--tRNA ligase [Candidatus Bipolaricaulota bacterium]
MNKITASELRRKYIEFFVSKGHKQVASASLIPENDPTVLFTTAGMHPLVPYLMGESHAQGQRLVDFQKCVRTDDIDEVGDAFHHTFFEMLGNWSLGDYFKKEAIEWSFEFLTDKKWLGLPLEKLAITCFEGDDNSPKDDESAGVWKNLGLADHKIVFLGKKDNWWGPAGETGPCGPDTEMFYFIGEGNPSKDSNPQTDEKNWVEIWNDVFMQYNKTADGNYEQLIQKNVDTGMGLERTLAVMNGFDDNYRTELFWPIIEKIEALSGKKYDESEKITVSMRIIADHLKASVMILGDDHAVAPSNVDQGYILRRLIRRAIRQAKQLGIERNFTAEVASVVVDLISDPYVELKNREAEIFDELKKEEEKFRMTLEKGEREFSKMAKDKNISGKEAFILFSTYGFPLEMTSEMAKEIGIEIDEKEFAEEFKKHQELSKTASAGRFKGGLADASEETKRLHTAAHLMLAALRKVLGNEVFQKGSNITPERLRFDFSHNEKMTDEQKAEVEKNVNEAIEKDYPVSCEEITLDEAKKIGAMGVFESKYGEKVKVYTVGEGDDIFSREICGGPHVTHTGELGKFRIKKEESSSAGVRRIKAVLE